MAGAGKYVLVTMCGAPVQRRVWPGIRLSDIPNALTAGEFACR